MQVRARLLSDRPEAAASLRSIGVDLSDPLAARLVGEVWPNRIETIGRPDSLSYFIRPSFGSAQQGFDEVMIVASAGTVVELLEVRWGSQAEFRSGQAERISPAQLEVLASRADTLWVRLPALVDQDVELLEVWFRPTIFANSATFKAWVQDSVSPGFWQRVDAGDATDLVNSQVTTVLALEDNQVIRDLRLDSVVLTPNGDGVNDVLTFTFGVARVNADREVSLAIYDLGGRMVGRVAERRTDPRGSYALVWSGEDTSGRVVPPGIYVARIGLEVDRGEAAASVYRVVRVAY